MSELTIEQVAIDSVSLDPANARLHNDRNLEAIKGSLRRFGQRKPIVVDAQGIIRAGNGAWLAAKSLGWETIAISRWKANGSEATAYAIADNQTALLADWDTKALAAQLDSILKEDSALFDACGFDQKEFDQLMRQLGNGELQDPPAQMDRAAELQEKWGTESGQLWLVEGKQQHRLLCGDSTKREDVERLLGGMSPELMVTSPPYNQKIDSFKPSGMHKEGDWVAKVGRLAYSDSMPEPDYQAWQLECLGIWHEFMSDGSSVFYNHKNRYRDKRIVSPLEWLPGPFRIRQEIVWSRPGSVTQNARMFLPSDERIYWMYKGNGFYFADTTEFKSWSTVWKIGLETNKSHAVAFPVELPARCIMACSRENGSVFDAYVGSGTTMVAAEQLGRRCYGMEISPAYCAVILERMTTLGCTCRLEK